MYLTSDALVGKEAQGFANHPPSAIQPAVSAKPTVTLASIGCRVTSPRFSATLIIETLALLSFAFLLLFPGPVTNTGSRVVLPIALSSLAMGMQSVNARHFGVAGIPTTYITGTITSTIIGITHWFRSMFMPNESKNEQKNQKQDKDQQQIGFQSGVWLVYVIAAALAAVTETRLPAVAVFLPLVSSILVLLTAILYQLA